MDALPFNIAFALLLAGGWLAGKLSAALRLPAILGMVAFGILAAIFGKDLAPPLLWELAPSLKSFALVVILLRAGLGLSRATLQKVGLTAILMAALPCLFEGAALTLLIHSVFGFSWTVAALTAFMLAAVSPAVVVPSMLDFASRGIGKKNEVPTLILAGASADDVFAITLFSVFLGLATASGATAGGGNPAGILETILSIPLSIVIGIASGLLAGFLLSLLFKRHYTTIRATEKALLLLVCGTLLVAVGDTLHFAALLGLMAAGFLILERHETIAHELAGKLQKLWVFAEIVLFVLIGYSLEPQIALDAGFKGILVILGGIAARSAGVFAATAFSPLSFKERLFCAIAYIPKATVQAALGGVALSAGLPEGQTILALAVLAILFTAPLGLIGIRWGGKHLLMQDEPAPRA